MSTYFSEARSRFHNSVLESLIRLNNEGIPNFADATSATSSAIAKEIYKHLGCSHGVGDVGPQQAGKKFEECVLDFIKDCFNKVKDLRPGAWGFSRNENIANFEQYIHLNDLKNAAKKDLQLGAVLGSDYVIKPDIIVYRRPEPDEVINKNAQLVDEYLAKLTPLRVSNQECNFLHASISCKWTIRSDRSQNSRTEALNLIRNRKGRVPHIVVVTAEPLPSRIASIALGTGDIDCTYHFALGELINAVAALGQEEAINIMRMMVEGKRLRDISDLPFDLAV